MIHRKLLLSWTSVKAGDSEAEQPDSSFEASESRSAQQMAFNQPFPGALIAWTGEDGGSKQIMYRYQAATGIRIMASDAAASAQARILLEVPQDLLFCQPTPSLKVHPMCSEDGRHYFGYTPASGQQPNHLRYVAGPPGPGGLPNMRWHA